MMAKRRKAFRRAALLLSAAARLRRYVFIAMSIARMIPLCDDHYRLLYTQKRPPTAQTLS